MKKVKTYKVESSVGCWGIYDTMEEAQQKKENINIKCGYTNATDIPQIVESDRDCTHLEMLVFIFDKLVDIENVLKEKGKKNVKI